MINVTIFIEDKRMLDVKMPQIPKVGEILMFEKSKLITNNSRYKVINVIHLIDSGFNFQGCSVQLKKIS